MSDQKICKKCKKLLPNNLEYFHKNSEYLHPVCKICRNSENPVVKNTKKLKQCTACNKKLKANLENFHYSKREKDGLRSKCKICRNQEKKKYRNKNKEEINKKNKIYYNRADVAVKIKAKRQTPEYKEKYNAKNRLNYKTNLKIKLVHNMRTSFNRYFSGKRKHSFEYIGLTLEEFKIYIESLFLPNMTWDNYGKYGWHIDHITPLSSFNFSNYTGEELEKLIHKAYHYTNLQPLWAKDNLSKGGKIKDE